MIEWVKKNTPADARIWFFKVRALRWLSGRTAVGASDFGYASAAEAGPLIESVLATDSRYLIVKNDTREDFRQALARGTPLKEIWTNSAFTVFSNPAVKRALGEHGSTGSR